MAIRRIFIPKYQIFTGGGEITVQNDNKIDLKSAQNLKTGQKRNLFNQSLFLAEFYHIIQNNYYNSFGTTVSLLDRLFLFPDKRAIFSLYPLI